MDDGIKIITTAVSQDVEERLMFRWIVGGYEKFISFDEFKENLNCDSDIIKSSDARSEEEILADVKNILIGFADI